LDFAILSLIIAGLAFVVTIFNSFIELKSIRITQRIQDWLGHESEVAAMERENQPSMVEQFDSYLAEYDEEAKMSKIEAIGALIGKGFFRSSKASAMQEASVDSRAFNKYDAKIQDAVKQQMPIGYKFLFKVAEELGFDLNEILDAGELTQFVDAAKKNRLDLLMGASDTSSNNGRM